MSENQNEFSDKAKSVFDVVEEAVDSKWSYGDDKEAYAVEATQKILAILGVDEKEPVFVPQFYRMDPETETLLFDGEYLRDGMRILIEEPNFRANPVTAAFDLSGGAYDNAMKMNRWMEVSQLRIDKGERQVEFIGIYDDETMRKHRWDIKFAWLVKQASIPVSQAMVDYCVADVLEDPYSVESLQLARDEAIKKGKMARNREAIEKARDAWDGREPRSLPVLSELITDMTIRGAKVEELAPVIAESMVAMDRNRSKKAITKIHNVDELVTDDFQQAWDQEIDGLQVDPKEI